MDRSMVYTGAVPLDTDWLFPQRAAMVAHAKLAEIFLGTAPVVDGLQVQPTLPTSLAVTVLPGQIYAMASIDPVAYGSMEADTVHQVMKQGILLDALRLPITAPGTAGFSQWFLVQASYQDKDDGSVVLPYYNSANPQQPFAGPGNSGQQQYTRRLGVVTIQTKAGPPGATGSHVQPQPDPGWTGLAWINVANGQAVVLAQHITPYLPSSRLPAKLPQLARLAGAKVGVVGTTRTLSADDLGLSIVDVQAMDGPIELYLPPAGSIPGVPLRHKVVGRYVSPRVRKATGYARVRPGPGDTMDYTFAYCGPNDSIELVSDGLSRWFLTTGQRALLRVATAAGDQSVPSGIVSPIRFAPISGSDLPEGYNASFPSRVYAPVHGRYRLVANIAFLPVTNQTATTRSAFFGINGYQSVGNGMPSIDEGINAGDGYVTNFSSAGVGLDAGDYIELMAYQNTGGPMVIQASLTWMSLELSV